MNEVITSESLKKSYRRYSRYYDFLFGAAFHPGRKAAVEHLNCTSGDRVLEVGVGTGLSLNMYPASVKVVGIDLSEEMLNRARQKVQQEKLIQVEELIAMDAQDMDFPDNSFDKVVAMYVASVVPNLEKMMTEIRRVCKPDGAIIFLNHFENENPIIRHAETLAQPLAKYLGFHPDFPLDEFLVRTSFHVKEKIPVNFLDYWTILVGSNEKGTLPRKRQSSPKVKRKLSAGEFGNCH